MQKPDLLFKATFLDGPWAATDRMIHEHKLPVLISRAHERPQSAQSPLPGDVS
jgi:hypothetical protein